MPSTRNAYVVFGSSLWDIYLSLLNAEMIRDRVNGVQLVFNGVRLR